MNIVCVGFKRMFLVWRGKLPLLALITASCWNRSFNRFESCQYRSGSMFCAKSPGLRHFPVEAGKPAPAVWAVLGQGDLCWSGPMPVWGNVLCEVSRLAAFSCGSGLARDGGVSAEGVLAGPTLSRASPLPQFGLCWGRGFVRGQKNAPNQSGRDCCAALRLGLPWGRSGRVRGA